MNPPFEMLVYFFFSRHIDASRFQIQRSKGE